MEFKKSTPKSSSIKPQPMPPLPAVIRAKKSRKIYRLISAIKNIDRKKLVIVSICCLVVVAVIAQTAYRRNSAPDQAKTNKPDTTTSYTKSGTLSKGVPDYTTLLPSGRTIESLGGWTRVSPPDREPVFAYADTVAGTSIIVSQQPLPKDFKDDTADQIELLAQGYNAEKHISVGKVKVYIGTSAKGPQSAIFTKNNLLILIKASAKLTDEQWTEYINGLH